MATAIAQQKGDTQIIKERQEYLTAEYGALVGKTVQKVRPLTREECEDMAWEFGYEREACVIVFTDGTAFIPMQDPEGNGAGFLMLAKVEKVK